MHSSDPDYMEVLGQTDFLLAGKVTGNHKTLVYIIVVNPSQYTNKCLE